MDIRNEKKTFQLGEKVRLKPNESAVIGGRLKVTNEGYGHKRTEKGDRPMVGLKLEDGDETKYLHFYTTNLPSVKQDWRGWTIIVTNCENHGPPHDREASTEWVIDRP